VTSTLASASRLEKTRVVAVSIARTLLTVGAIFWVYAATPRPTTSEDVMDGAPLVLFALVVFVGVFTWQVRRIRRSRHPGLRALEAGVSSLAVFLVAFAIVYLAWSTTYPDDFSEPLQHVTAMYFTVTVFATVGFGDITPTADPTRIITSIQMLLDLVFIGALVKVLFQVAQNTAANREQNEAPPPSIEA
jgi:NAD/NADP transhydrogenase beta subunit